MAKEEVHEETNVVDNPSTTAPASKTVETTMIRHPRNRWVIIAIVIVTLLVLMAIGGVIARLVHGAERFEGRTMQGSMSRTGYGGHGRMMNPGVNYGSGVVTNVARLSGVVTAIDGTTLTVAGSGTTTKVTTSSGTIYGGDASSVKANDTVAVLGNKNSDGSIAASEIVISRQ